MGYWLGAIADDFTGATDLGALLTRSGLRSVVCVGVPPEGLELPPCEAVIVALKSRSTSVRRAVGDSLSALMWLRRRECARFYFKYCSTFDSTAEGNIGPVADALLDALGEDFTVVCPAHPENGRTVYRGYLFVGDELLSESPMRHHPLTPMRDSNLLRLLGQQTPHRVGLAGYAQVSGGVSLLRHSLKNLRAEGYRYAVVDALEQQHLLTIAAACQDLSLTTGAAGLAMGLAYEARERGQVSVHAQAPFPRGPGPTAVLAGSCSPATLAQIATMQRFYPSRALDPELLVRDPQATVEDLARWAGEQAAAGPVLVYASAPPRLVRRYTSVFGPEIAARIEEALARLACRLVAAGFNRLVVAGGETSGAVVQALGIQALIVCPEIVPGVPWTRALPHSDLALALKSGNFGAPDFFLKALEMLIHRY